MYRCERVRFTFGILGIVFSLSLLNTTEPAKASPILFINDSAGRLATVDVADGTATLIGSMGVVMTDIAFDPSGNLFGLDFTNLYTINSTTAAVSLIGAHGVDEGNALVFATDGTLFAAGAGTTSLFTLSPGTGASTAIADIGFASAGDLAFINGDFFLSSLQDQLIRIDLGSPTTASVIGSFGFSNVFGLATAEDGVLYGIAETEVFSVNTGTGAGTLASDYRGQGISQSFGSSFVSEAVIPEPSTLLLLAVGSAMLSAKRRRSQRR